MTVVDVTTSAAVITLTQIVGPQITVGNNPTTVTLTTSAGPQGPPGIDGPPGDNADLDLAVLLAPLISERNVIAPPDLGFDTAVALTIEVDTEIGSVDAFVIHQSVNRGGSDIFTVDDSGQVDLHVVDPEAYGLTINEDGAGLNGEGLLIQLAGSMMNRSKMVEFMATNAGGNPAAVATTIFDGGFRFNYLDDFMSDNFLVFDAVTNTVTAKAHPGQTEPLAVWRGESGDSVVMVGPTGQLVVAPSDPLAFVDQTTAPFVVRLPIGTNDQGGFAFSFMDEHESGLTTMSVYGEWRISTPADQGLFTSFEVFDDSAGIPVSIFKIRSDHQVIVKGSGGGATDPFAVTDGNDVDNLRVTKPDIGDSVLVTSTSDLDTPLSVFGFGGGDPQSAPLAKFQSEDRATTFQEVMASGALVSHITTEPDDADLTPSSHTTWLDDTAGAPLLMAKMKDADGDPFSATLTGNLPAATPFTVVTGIDYEAGDPATARYIHLDDESVTVFGVIVGSDLFPRWVFTGDCSIVMGNGAYDPLNPDVPVDASGIIGLQPQNDGCALFGSGCELILASGHIEAIGSVRAEVLSATDLLRRDADAAPQVELRYNYDPAVGAPPADHGVSFDNADPALATAIYIDADTGGFVDATDILRTFPVATIKAVSSNEGNYVTYEVTGRTEHVGYQEFAVTVIDSAGVLFGLDVLRFTGRRGVESRNTEPADATLLEGGYTTWVDPTAGAPLLMVKAKDANGDVFTASIPLATA